LPDLSTLALFSAAALALIVIPGPAVLYVVAQSVRDGRLAGIVAAAGIAGGALVHVAGAAVGLSSLLASSAAAFELVKYLGPPTSCSWASDGCWSGGRPTPGGPCGRRRRSGGCSRRAWSSTS